MYKLQIFKNQIFYLSLSGICLSFWYYFCVYVYFYLWMSSCKLYLTVQWSMSRVIFYIYVGKVIKFHVYGCCCVSGEFLCEMMTVSGEFFPSGNVFIFFCWNLQYAIEQVYGQSRMNMKYRAVHSFIGIEITAGHVNEWVVHLLSVRLFSNIFWTHSSCVWRLPRL